MLELVETELAKAQNKEGNRLQDVKRKTSYSVLAPHASQVSVSTRNST